MNPPPASLHECVSKIVCAQGNDQVFYKNQCVEGKNYEDCSNLALFNANYHIDSNDPQISNHILKWKSMNMFIILMLQIQHQHQEILIYL